MEAEARYTWVGAAVLALLAALVAALLWLRQSGDEENFRRYAIRFEQQALDGLEIGAPVNLRGIRIGRVESYGLPGDHPNWVRVQVLVDRRAGLRDNTVAVITRNFVTGIAGITLVTGDPPGAPLEAVPAGETLPLIGEGRSDLQQIAGRVNEVGEAATIAIGNINQLLAAENRDAFMSTVRSLDRLAGEMQQRLATLDRTLQRVGRAAEEMGHTAVKVGDAVHHIGSAGDQVTRTTAALGRTSEEVLRVAERSGLRLEAALVDTQVTLAEARTAFARIAAASETLQQQTERSANQLEQSAAQIDDQLGAAVAELRMSLETGARVLDRLRDPRAALLGPGPAQLGPGEAVR